MWFPSSGWWGSLPGQLVGVIILGVATLKAGSFLGTVIRRWPSFFGGSRTPINKGRGHRGPIAGGDLSDVSVPKRAIDYQRADRQEAG